MTENGIGIAAVERETGLSKDVLRVWERRYGFPVPARDEHGERTYSAEEVARLRLIKRLMDMGHRPGKLLPLSLDALQALGPRRSVGAAESAVPDALPGLLEWIRLHDSGRFLLAMQQRLARQGLQAFVLDSVAPLGELVGEAWARGELQVFEEHLFSEMTQRVLRQAIAGLSPSSTGPRLLLTSVPGESHCLGLLMLEALCTLEGANCVPLGLETPLQDIVLAAEAHRVDIVALSFSAAFPARQVAPALQQLRAALPPAYAVWVGGQGVQRATAQPGVRVMQSLLEAADEVRRLAEAH